ncbi:MAG: hypothetical protein LZF64_03255 [Nitrosomonas sp.]|nr:hypothetical protein [Nitrosomonas sp.]MCG7757642.1 hypothetical protein [Nitrosomonas sp.]UJP00814.1 MAG: hypothetical protein LZF64_03255 [Nitrosomonas sp.]
MMRKIFPAFSRTIGVDDSLRNEVGARFDRSDPPGNSTVSQAEIYNS